MFPPTDELEISVTTVAALQQAQDSPDYTLLDCRENDEHSICRLENSMLIPLHELIEKAPSHLPNLSQPIVVYCHHGLRSQEAALMLRSRGYDNVWSMKGGIEAWSLDIDPAVPRY